MSLMRYDRGEVKGKAARTDEGYIRADAVVTRTGVFQYMNADGTIRRELRHPDDVFEKASLDSMRLIPVTNGHPQVRLVNSDNAKELIVGSVGESVYVDGQFVMASMVITHADATRDVDMGRKELSLGYTVDVVKEDGIYNGEPYTHRQKNIRYNHLAIVDRARAGSAARINLDSGDAQQTTKEDKMNVDLKTVTLDGLDYKASPEVAKALEKAIKRADEAQAEAKTAKDEAEKLQAKIDAMKEKEKEDEEAEKGEKEKMDGMIKAAVKARLALEKVASVALDKETVAKLDDMSDKEIKLAVIKAKSPNANLDEKSDVYIDARFDAAVEDQASFDPEAAAKNRQATHAKLDGAGKERSSEDARKDALDSMYNAYKKETK